MIKDIINAMKKGTIHMGPATTAAIDHQLYRTISKISPRVSFKTITPTTIILIAEDATSRSSFHWWATINNKISSRISRSIAFNKHKDGAVSQTSSKLRTIKVKAMCPPLRSTNNLKSHLSHKALFLQLIIETITKHNNSNKINSSNNFINNNNNSFGSNNKLW